MQQTILLEPVSTGDLLLLRPVFCYTARFLLPAHSWCCSAKRGSLLSRSRSFPVAGVWNKHNTGSGNLSYA